MVCNVILTLAFVLMNGQSVSQTFYADQETATQLEQQLASPEMKNIMKSKGVKEVKIEKKEIVKDFDCEKGPEGQ